MISTQGTKTPDALSRFYPSSGQSWPEINQIQLKPDFRKPVLKSSWLHCFVTASQKAKCSTAARSLELTPQALRRNLQELEKHLGTQVVICKQDEIELTPVGQILFEEAVEILRELRRIGSRLSAGPRQQLQTLTLGCTSDWLQTLMLPLFGLLKAQNPDLTLRIQRLAGPTELEQALLDGRIDLALDWREPSAEAITYLSGRPNPYVVVSAPAQPRQWHSWHYATPYVHQGSFKPWEYAEYPPLIQNESDQLSALLALALNGLCALYVPECLVRNQLAAGLLVQIAEAPVFHALTLHLLWRSGRDQVDYTSLAQRFFGT